MQGYSQKAVLPTPTAPIISTWTSPVSTIAVVLPAHPTTMPCGSGFPSSPVGVFPLFAWSRHFFGVKEIKAAVMYALKGQIAYNNDGMRASYRASNHSFNLLARNGVRIEGNTVTQNGEPLFKIHRRHATRKTQGCYRELMPTLEYVRQEQKQGKPSIRDQLKAAAKTQPEKKSPVKSKTHDMEL